MGSYARICAQRFVFVFALLAFAAAALDAQMTPQPSHPAIALDYGKLPLSFEANQGQAGSGVRFLSRGSGYGLDLTDSGAILSLRHPASLQRISKGTAKPLALTDTIKLRLVGANGQSQVSGADRLPGVANYMIGNDPSKWHTNLPTYAKVKYRNVYPGVDLVYYGNQGRLEYDFVLAPKASSEAIRLQFGGATRLNLSANGDLQVTAAHGAIAFARPIVYQLNRGQRQHVQGRFKLLANHQIAFALGRYDHSQPLIIDPVLTYATYLGSLGNLSTLGGISVRLAVDSVGDAFIAGDTQSSSFPITAGSYQATNNDTTISTAFVSKLNPAGTALLYSTYLGGSGNSTYGDEAYGITVDSSGDVYVAGTTGSADFPITGGAFQTDNRAAANGGANIFVAELNPAGNALVYSTFLGGTANDFGESIAIDNSGNAYVTGGAQSADFPVTNGAFQSQDKASPTGNTGATATANAFITKLNSTGSRLIYSTYLGGSGNVFDIAFGIAVDGAGDAYVTGRANSTDFPIVAGAFQSVNNAAANGNANAFVTKINPTGTALVYSTYLGGSGGTQGDGAAAIALDSSNNAYVTGYADSTDFPVTSGAFQTVNKAAANFFPNAFVTKINPNGTALLYSTYLGGSEFDEAFGIAVDSLGNAYVVGQTASTNFPVTSGALQTVSNEPFGAENCFVSKFNPTGTALLYSTYLGGSGGDYGLAIELDGLGNAYVAGYTGSSDFPVTKGAYDTTFPGKSLMVFVAKLAIGSPATPTIPTTTTVTSSANPQTQGASVTFTSTVIANSGTVTPTGSVVFSVDGDAVSTVALNGSGGAAYTTSALTVGPHTIVASYGGSETDETSTANLTETIITAAASTTTTLSSSSLTSDQNASVTFTAAVSSSVAGSITGTVTFYDGTTSLGTGTLTSGTATYTTSSLSVGTHSITAMFGGDTLYLTSTSPSISQVVVAPSIAFTATPTTLTVAKGSSGTVVITSTPTGGYTGTVTFACGTLPADASCTFAPPSLSFTGSNSAETSTLTFSTKAATSAALTPGLGGSYAPGILAALLLLPLGLRKRLPKLSAKLRLVRVTPPLLLILATAGLLGISGCGSSGPATTPTGTYAVVVTITGGISTSTLNLTIVVQ